MITFVASPGQTPIADEYRDVSRALQRVPCEPGVFEREAYDPRSVREACRHWQTRMVDEYASTTVYSGLSGQLMEAGATLDVNVVVLRMAQDEFRHAEVCGGVALAMGGANHETRDATVQPLPLHAGCSRQERALRNVLVTSLSEMYSVAFFVASLDRMTDPYLRTVTRSLLADEVLHGRFGFYYLEQWVPWLEAHPGARVSISSYLRLAFAACEREFVRDRMGGERGVDDDALGLVPTDVARDVFTTTMEYAIAPSLDGFGLDGTRAWRSRSLG